MGSNIRVTKVCKLCGQQFVARKTSTQYCSHKCSQRAYKIRKRAAVEIAHNEGVSRLRKFSSKKTTKKPPENKLSAEQLHILQYKEFLSVLEVSHLLGVCRATINNYCANGLLKCIKMNRKIFIRRKDIDTLYAHIHQLGYRSMPKEMYLKWLSSLKNEYSERHRIRRIMTAFQHKIGK